VPSYQVSSAATPGSGALAPPGSGRHDGGVRALRILQRQSDAASARVQAEVASELGAGAGAAPRLALAAVSAHRAMDAAGARALAGSDRTPACAAGCSHCCHVHADATVPEVLAIVAHLERAWTAEARAALRDRLARQALAVAHLTDDERWAARIPCALLDGAGRCTIHAARPLRCRAFHSCSAAPCRAAFEGAADVEPEPVRIARLDRAHDAVELGYDRALAAAGLSARAHRLELALSIALDVPDAGARWLAGEEDVFAPARSPDP
jgi:hypothetical protein